MGSLTTSLAMCFLSSSSIHPTHPSIGYYARWVNNSSTKSVHELHAYVCMDHNVSTPWLHKIQFR